MPDINDLLAIAVPDPDAGAAAAPKAPKAPKAKAAPVTEEAPQPAEAPAAEAPADEPKAEPEAPKIPETVEVKTREGYTIVGRKPTFGDRRWMFIMPEGMKLPAAEVMPAACIVSVIGPDKKPVELSPEIHPWFYLEQLGIEGPLVYMGIWNDTYMPSNGDIAQGMLYAMQELAKGNA